MPRRQTIYTVGHSNRSLEEFIRLLKKHGIDLVVDVRRWPTSSKFPHFNMESLREELGKNGIEYIWLGDLLGGYRKGGYQSYMESAQYREGILKIESLSREHTVAIMCSEKLWFRCHRRFISDTLVKKGYRVVHVIDEKRVQEHKVRGETSTSP